LTAWCDHLHAPPLVVVVLAGKHQRLDPVIGTTTPNSTGPSGPSDYQGLR
jgi:hypothetical protein